MNLISSLQNPLVKHLVKLREDKKYRYEKKLIVVEGQTVTKEIIPFIKSLFCLDPSQLQEFHGERWIVTDAIMKKIAGVSTSEGIVAELHMPSFSDLKGFKHVIAFDGINDPGNLGTLLRTALAFGWEGVFILPNSCDPFNEKVIRAARGAHFRLPIAMGDFDILKKAINENKWCAYAADLEGKSPEEIEKREEKVLILGNEARGISPEVEAICSKVTIPMQGKMESLNVGVAGSILMYLLKPNL